MICAGVGVARADHVTGAVGDRGEGRGEGMPLKDGAAGSERREAWLEGVAEEPSDVLVGMGATGHHRMAPYSFLVSRGHRAAAVDPLQVRAMRRLRGLGRVKDDRAGAAPVAEAPRIGQHDPTRPATDEVQSLRTPARRRQSPKAGLAEARARCTCPLGPCSPELAGALSGPFGAAARAVPPRGPLPLLRFNKRRADVAR